MPESENVQKEMTLKIKEYLEGGPTNQVWTKIIKQGVINYKLLGGNGNTCIHTDDQSISK